VEPARSLAHIKRVAIAGVQVSKEKELQRLIGKYPHAPELVVETITTSIYISGAVKLLDIRAPSPPQYLPQPSLRGLSEKFLQLPPWKRKKLLKKLPPHKRRLLRKLRPPRSLKEKEAPLMAKRAGADALLFLKLKKLEYDEDEPERSYVKMVIKVVGADGSLLWITPVEGILHHVCSDFAKMFARYISLR
jgi:hypothetical protein